jgi:hypothetical protein
MGKKKWQEKKLGEIANPVEDEQQETPVETAEPVEAVQTESQDAATNNFAEAAEKLEAQGIEPVAPVEVKKTEGTRGVIPDQFGNNVKGERICSVCGIKESETLAKNPRYSFCKGKCVNCYGKTERKTVKPSDLTIPQLEEKIAYYKDLLAKKVGAQGLPEGTAIENPNEVTDGVTTETHGASVASTSNTTDELATISQ